MSLSDVMEFDHVVEVKNDGSFTHASNMYAPEVHIEASWDDHGDPSVFREHENALSDSLRGHGWEFYRPPRAFGTVGSPFMENCHYIGPSMEEDILETPGFYVAVVVEILPPDGDDRESPNPYGWAILHKENS